MDPDTDEWPLRDPTAVASADSGAGPRLSALIDAVPRFPKLPPAESYVYGSLAKKQQAASEKERAQREAKQEDADLQRGIFAEARRTDGPPVRRAAATRVRFAGGGSDPESDDGGSEMRDETDSASTASSSHPLDDDDDSKASADVEDDDLAVVSRARSPPDADAGPDEIAALPHSTKPRGTAAMSGRDTTDELYDPHADEEDEAWMRTQVQPRAPAKTFQRNQRKKGPGATAIAAEAAAAAASAAAAAVPSTDAHLSCPACFTPLCFDCQRHATRPTLFRAMFVLGSVLVDRGHQVRPEPGTADAERPDMKFFVVLCRTCKTHVGVMDEDEVFHFFNVIDSAA